MPMKRIAASLSEEAAEAIDRLAAATGSSRAAVVEAAGLVIAEDGAPAREIRRKVAPERRGGKREGAGRKLKGEG